MGDSLKIYRLRKISAQNEGKKENHPTSTKNYWFLSKKSVGRKSVTSPLFIAWV